MRINSIPPKEIFYNYVHVREKAAPISQPNRGVDNVELTSDAKTFSAALKAAKESLAVRTPAETKRIDEVKQQIQNNTYSVPGSAVAGKMLGNKF